MQCELCGKNADLFVGVVEGIQLRVCAGCGKHGKILNKVKPQPVRQAKKAIIQEPVEHVIDDYAQRIRNAREKLDMTQQDFAKRINVKESLIHKMETGHYEPPIEMARKLEKLLHITLVEVREEKAYVPGKEPRSAGLTIGDILKLKR